MPARIKKVDAKYEIYTLCLDSMGVIVDTFGFVFLNELKLALSLSYSDFIKIPTMVEMIALIIFSSMNITSSTL